MTFEEMLSRLDAAGWELWHLGNVGGKWSASAHRKKALWLGKRGSGMWPKVDHTPTVTADTLGGVFASLLVFVTEERISAEQSAALERAIEKLTTTCSNL